MRTFPSLVPVCALASVLALLTPVASADPRPDPRNGSGAGAGAQLWHRPGIVDGSHHKPQTSDGVVGEIVAPLPPHLLGATTPRAAIRRQWQVVPGVNATVWDEHDARGPIRAYLLAVDWKAKGVTLDYANDGAVQRTAPVKQILARDGAIAGVNGDFFDIGDTGAPLGIGRDRQRGLLNGRAAGWNSTFSINKWGRPAIGVLSTTATIKERPGLRITNVNSPAVTADSVGLYTRAWGRTSGYRVTDGQTSHVRMVLVRDGRVVDNRVKLPMNTKINGQLLIGRGAGAKALVNLKPGKKVTLQTHLEGTPRMAITGNAFLVKDGLITARDDAEMHPRTAIGIDNDTHEILLLVVDGRQSFSRGYTMVEMANMMIDLGADEAINLDGGGSSTMVARRPGGPVDVINSPSDGFQRSVANAVEVTYRR